MVTAVIGRDPSASARLVLANTEPVRPVNIDASTEPSFARYVHQRAIVATSTPVLRRALDQLDGSADVDSLRKKVSAAVSGAGDAMTITATAALAQRPLPSRTP